MYLSVFNPKCPKGSEDLHNGVIVETAPISEFAGGGVAEELDRFAEAVGALHIDSAAIENAIPSFSVVSLHGDTLRIRWGGPHLVNNVPVDYNQWPLLETPWIHQDPSGKYLTIKYDDAVETYDFEAWRKN